MLYTKHLRNVLSMFLRNADEYHGLLETEAGYFEKEFLSGAKKVDQEGIFPRENLAKLKERGVMAMPFPRDYGGRGLPYPVFIATLEMLAMACANTALQVSIQAMVCEGIRVFGNEMQKEEFLKAESLIDGSRLIAFALTEPGCGSDAKAIRTRAEFDGGGYVLDGTKMLITNAAEADFMLVFAATDSGISSFIVPRQTPGILVLKDIPKLGFRGNSLSAIHLKKCRVPREYLLGEKGQGLELAKQLLNAGRITIAAIAVGIARAAYEKALSYSTQRKAFGESLSHFELVQEKIADMLTGINASRLLTFYAAGLKDRGYDIAAGASQAKLFSSETAVKVCDSAIQLHGGYGYLDEYDIHRHWRDARMLMIGEGTSEMLRLLIAHLALK